LATGAFAKRSIKGSYLVMIRCLWRAKTRVAETGVPEDAYQAVPAV
jgi:hypothetical protein